MTFSQYFFLSLKLQSFYSLRALIVFFIVFSSRSLPWYLFTIDLPSLPSHSACSHRGANMKKSCFGKKNIKFNFILNYFSLLSFLSLYFSIILFTSLELTWGFAFSGCVCVCFIPEIIHYVLDCLLNKSFVALYSSLTLFGYPFFLLFSLRKKHLR